MGTCTRNCCFSGAFIIWDKETDCKPKAMSDKASVRSSKSHQGLRREAEARPGNLLLNRCTNSRTQDSSATQGDSCPKNSKAGTGFCPGALPLSASTRKTDTLRAYHLQASRDGPNSNSSTTAQKPLSPPGSKLPEETEFRGIPLAHWLA